MSSGRPLSGRCVLRGDWPRPFAPLALVFVLLALDADTYVTGHGDLMTKDDVSKKLAFIQDRWDKIKAMVAQGKSLDDVKTAMGESTAPPMPNAQGNMPPASFTEIIYNELTKKG